MSIRCLCGPFDCFNWIWQHALKNFFVFLLPNKPAYGNHQTKKAFLISKSYLNLRPPLGNESGANIIWFIGAWIEKPSESKMRELEQIMFNRFFCLLTKWHRGKSSNNLYLKGSIDHSLEVSYTAICGVSIRHQITKKEEELLRSFQASKIYHYILT